MSEKKEKLHYFSTLKRMLLLDMKLKMERNRVIAVLVIVMSMIPGVLSALCVPALEWFIAGVSRAVAGEGFGIVIGVALIMGGIYLLSYFTDCFSRYWNNIYRVRIQSDLMRLTMRSVAAKEPASFEDPAMLNAIEKGKQGVQSFEEVCSYLLSDAVYTLLYIAVLVVYFAQKNLALVLMLPVTVLPVILAQAFMQKFSFDMQEKQAPISRATTYCEKCLVDREYFKETRLLGAYSYFYKRFENHLKEYCRLNRQLMLKSKAIILLANLISLAGFAAMLVVMVVELRAGRIAPAAFAAVFAALLNICGTISNFFRMFGFIVSHELPVVGNLLKILDMPERKGEDCEVNGVNGLTLENVHFSYPGAENEAVRGVTIDIKPGETIAIVGENGSGKTTLVRLLTGLYLPTQGSVRIGGKCTSEIAVPSAVKNTSAVFQKYVKYKMSLADNVRISNVEGSGAIALPLENAGLPVDSPCFTDGDDTMLSREFDGVDLSGGQWQRVAIARGLYRVHGLIVLDEPTAAIDPLEETRIYQKFAELAQEATAVIVTHRMGSARIANRIVVMKEGVIDDIGDHDSLMAKRGLYAQMVEAQAEWYK